MKMNLRAHFQDLTLAAGLLLLCWATFLAFALLLMFPVRPDSALSWWVFVLSPIPIALIAGTIFLVRQLPPVIALTRALARIPVLPRMLLAVVAGTLLIMALVTFRNELAALWPFSYRLDFARWGWWERWK